MTDIITPTLGESVTEATVGRWFKQAGEAVRIDEPVAELETDKVTLEVNAPAAGVLSEILATEGAIVAPGALLARISEGAAAAAPAPKSAPAPQTAQPAPRAPAPAAPALPSSSTAMPPSPAALKTALDRGVDLSTLEGSGKRGQVLKGDVLAATAAPPAPAARPTAPPP
ncbi:biotin/lipoyl-containing protein, partial [Methylocystis bryophila]